MRDYTAAFLDTNLHWRPMLSKLSEAERNGRVQRHDESGQFFFRNLQYDPLMSS